MRKIAFMGLSVLLLVSCISKPKEEIEAMKTENKQVAEVAPQQSQQKNHRAVSIAESDFEMYRKNIVVKTMGDDYIVYEYSDVRIDKVAPLASRYCYETNPGKKAYLRDIYMHRNHKRRATFDCVDLASE